jgi:hypothetical protein
MRWRQNLILRRMRGEPVEVPRAEEPAEPTRPVPVPEEGDTAPAELPTPEPQPIDTVPLPPELPLSGDST